VLGTDGNVGVTGEGLSVDACRTPQSMMDMVFEYVNSATWLSSKNMDRPNTKCAGRKVPRYITTTYAAVQNKGAVCSGASLGAGYECIRSVPYDWGGVDTVATYRTAMSAGSQAGDIDSNAVEACSRGIDCSGFVSRAWDLYTFYGVKHAGTKQLGSYSKSISGGKTSHPGCVKGASMPGSSTAPQAAEVTAGCKNSKSRSRQETSCFLREST
jgi:hypothetical protein